MSKDTAHSTVVHTFHSSFWEVEAGGVPSQPVLFSKFEGWMGNPARYRRVETHFAKPDSLNSLSRIQKVEEKN